MVPNIFFRRGHYDHVEHFCLPGLHPLLLALVYILHFLLYLLLIGRRRCLHSVKRAGTRVWNERSEERIQSSCRRYDSPLGHNFRMGRR